MRVNLNDVLERKCFTKENFMKRTKITDIVLGVIANMLDSQDVKGFKKYGRTLDTVPLGKYDWDLMAMEEMADGLKYLTMENIRLKEENKELRRMLKK
jgi:hypothetical protein